MQADFYSFVAHASGEVVLAEYRVQLEPGMNAFNLLVPDLSAFLLLLGELGVTVQQVNRLSDPHANEQEAFTAPRTGNGLSLLP